MTDSQPGTEKAPTIYDVARLAGVAPSTVSRAFARPGRVSLATTAKVREAAAALGYRREPVTSALSQVPTRLIAMVVADIGNAVFTEVIRGAEMEAEEAGYTLLVIDARESSTREARVAETFLEAVEGIILTSPRMPPAGILGIAKHRPVVVLNRVVEGLACVLTNGARGAAVSAEHLVDLGHDEITYVAGPEASWADGERWRGLVAASDSLGVRVRRLGPNVPTFGGGARAAKRWMDQRTPGVIAFNDMIAIGFMRALRQEGVDVPGEVGVIGFDNSREAMLVEPGLTSVASPLTLQGSTAIKNLLALIRGAAPPEKPLYLPVKLIKRGSTVQG
ncbi:MAG TPA: LacI family transcriptional regulator [Actinomycetales bacterium]|nr:LacI family transcriptional regulator [Actinomycetales bacterium]